MTSHNKQTLKAEVSAVVVTHFFITSSKHTNSLFLSLFYFICICPIFHLIYRLPDDVNTHSTVYRDQVKKRGSWPRLFPGMMLLLWVVFLSTLPPLVLLCGPDCCTVQDSSSLQNGKTYMI